jgi:hypothetical protein
MSEANVRQIMAAVGQLANGFQRHEVIDASGQIILNALRQEHARHIDAEAQLEALFDNMRASLRRDHYDDRGDRKDRRIIIPPLGQLVRN